jgi:hypothetical protein
MKARIWRGGMWACPGRRKAWRIGRAMELIECFRLYLAARRDDGVS